MAKPLRRGVGASNFEEVTPEQALDPKFNAFLGNVVLRINELKDMGDRARTDLYHKSKLWLAEPPETLRVADKHMRAYSILNKVGVIETTNDKTSGVFLEPSDRRHYVAWSEVRKTDFGARRKGDTATEAEQGRFWSGFHWWLDEEGGTENVAAHLATLRLTLDPKSPPPKTAAWWEIVNANAAPENAGLRTLLERIISRSDEPLNDHVAAVTIPMLASAASCIPDDGDLHSFLTDRRHARQVPHRLENAGLVPVRNDGDQEGRWHVGQQRLAIYGAKELTPQERIKAAQLLARRQRPILPTDL